LPHGIADCRHGPFRLGYPLAGFHTDITGKSFITGIYLPHPALQEGGLSCLSRGVQHPVETVPNVPMQLSAHKTLVGGKHVVIIRVTGAGGVKKSDFALSHWESIDDKTKK
jgi:hypothetical protein